MALSQSAACCHVAATPHGNGRDEAGGTGTSNARNSWWSLQDRESALIFDLRA
jgi:hypothetical protein